MRSHATESVAVEDAHYEGVSNSGELLRTESLRDAVAAVSEMTGVKKSEVYARALKLSDKS